MKSLKFSNENVAHEMRTPLGSIIIILDTLLSRVGDFKSAMTQKERRIRRLYRQIKAQM